MPSPLSRLAHALLILILCSGGATAQDIDPDRVFEAECLSCHGPASGFASRHLHLDGNTLLTSGGEDVADFLGYHRGGQPKPVIKGMVEMFRQSMSSLDLFAGPEKQCLFCHDRAHDFARRQLVLRGGKLVGRYTDHDVAAFLPGHAGLTPSEAAEIYTILESFLLPPR